MKLSGPQKRLLFEAMLDALPSEADLNALVTFSLDRPLNRFGGSDFRDSVLRTIEWARAQDRISHLIFGLRDAAPNNRAVQKLAETFSLDEGATGFEKTVFANVEIADPDDWRNGMIRSEKSVCRMETEDGVAVGTGFLIGPDVLATNFHVADGLDQAGPGLSRARARFDFHKDANSNAVAQGVVYQLSAPNPIVDSNRELDYCVLKLAEPAGDDPVGGQPNGPKRGHLNPVAHDFAANEPICIIQHPRGGHRKFAFGATCAAPIGADHVAYRVNTEPGSSGSPCFTHDWRLVAIHYFGGPDDDFNRGIKFSAILRSMRH